MPTTRFKLGMDLGLAKRTATASAQAVTPDLSRTATGATPAFIEMESGATKDYFVTRNGKCFAGTHLIIELKGAEKLDDVPFIERTLVEAVERSDATLLHIHLHHFTPNGGVSGVAVLAESHISIHTWPERGYAALDIFMCGKADPHKAVPVLEHAFRPSAMVVQELLRGEVTDAAAS
ncbi:MAG TPA: adenosylmethionine decarboxylase [Alphaproteobacteria bacterium]|nr:adenosylmethionine decarboxylase [Alphaproteobacteria bacterium]